MLVLKTKHELPTMEEFVNDFFGRTLQFDNTCDCAPRARIRENDDDYTISLALPGFKKEDVDISIEDDTLVISSTVEQDDFKKSFVNRYSIPEDADVNKIEASMEDGILKVVVIKYKELPKTNIKKIDIK